MEQEYDSLIQDSGGLRDQYYQDTYFNVAAEVNTERDFDIPIDAGFQDCLPRSLLAPEGGIENSGWTSGSFLVAPTESEPSMRCFNSISDYQNEFNSNSYTFSNLQNPSGTFFNAANGNPNEFLPESGGYRPADYSYSFATGTEQTCRESVSTFWDGLGKFIRNLFLQFSANHPSPFSKPSCCCQFQQETNKKEVQGFIK